MLHKVAHWKSADDPEIVQSWIKALHEKCPYSEFFWSVICHIRTEYEEILCIFPHLVQMWENKDHCYYYYYYYYYWFTLSWQIYKLFHIKIYII